MIARLCLTAALLAAAPAAIVSRAQAQQTPDAQPSPPKPDTAVVFSLQDENASISSAKLTDRYYVNGLKLGYTSAPGDLPDALAGAGRAVWGDGSMRIGFDLSQQIFTPADTAAAKPPPGDRPYAGILMATGSLYRDVQDSRSTLSLGLGVVGPWALAEQVQNGFHDVISQGHTNGWHYQLHNEPAVELTSARTWRLPTGDVAGFETDALPDLAVGLGNVRIYAQTGVLFRLGQGLGSDYGPTRVSNGPSGGDAFTPTAPFAWYVFAGADGQGIAHDITLNGNSFEDSPNVKLKYYMAEFEAGAALIAFGSRLSYTQVLQTQQFQHQKGGLHQLGSLALSVRF